METWPYVNGKALMSGLNLREMEASDMLDVLHFLFEEDFISSSEEEARSRSAVREVIYRDMYEHEYAFPLNNPSGVSNASNLAEAETYDDLDAELSADIDPFSPRKPETKPFIPVSTFDVTAAKPFDGLDAPLG